MASEGDVREGKADRNRVGIRVLIKTLNSNVRTTGACNKSGCREESLKAYKRTVYSFGIVTGKYSDADMKSRTEVGTGIALEPGSRFSSGCLIPDCKERGRRSQNATGKHLRTRAGAPDDS